MATAKQLAHRARAKKCFKIKGANRMSKVSACLRKKWFNLVLKQTTLGTTYNSSNPYGHSIALAKDELTLMGQNSTKFVEAFNQANRNNAPSPKGLLDYLQNSITTLKGRPLNSDIIQTSRDGTATSISSLSPLILVAGAVALILALK